MNLDQVRGLPSVSVADRSGLPDEPGIYYVFIDGEHLVYIGITGTSLRRRWKYHHRLYDLSRMGEATIAYAVERDDVACFHAEVDAVARFRPILNDLPGFQLGIEVVEGKKRFSVLDWEEGRRRTRERGRPRKPPPATP